MADSDGEWNYSEEAFAEEAAEESAEREAMAVSHDG